MPGRFHSFFRRLLTRRRAERELDEELQFHVEMETRANVERGMSAVEARRASLRDFGGTLQTREAVSDVRAGLLDSAWQDLRYAVRVLRRSPSYTSAALLTLGLGIGATTAVFSVADAVAFRPLPYADGGRLFAIQSRTANDGRISTAVGARDFLVWRDHQRVFDAVAVVGGGDFKLVEGEPEELRGARTTGDLFVVLRGRPKLGSVFGRDNEVPGREKVAVLMHGFWMRRFGGDPSIVGRRLQLDNGVYEVIGVMPEGFRYPAVGRSVDLLVPMTFDDRDRSLRGTSPGLGAIARLRPGVTAEQATAHLDRLSAGLPAVRGFRWRPFLLPFRDDEVEAKTRNWMVLLLGAAAFVLLVGCANVAHLTIARGTGRARELAVRAALGGGRPRLVRQLATEGLLLGGVATLLGLVLAAWGTRVLAAAMPASIRLIAPIAVDGRVFGFAAVCGVLAAVLCGVVPVTRGARTAVADVLRGGAQHAPTRRWSQYVRETLAFSELALSFVLLSGAAAFVLSFIHVMDVSPGFRVPGLVLVEVDVPDAVNQAGRGLGEELEVLERLGRLRGVSSAGLINGGWMFGGGRSMFPAHRPGQPRPTEAGPMSDLVWTSPGFFRMLGVPFVRGRDFTDRDGKDSPPVMLVNQTAARLHWPGEEPVGKQLVVEDRIYEVVGVVADIAHVGTDAGPRPELYMPLGQKAGPAYGTFVLRTTARASDDIAADVRRAVRSVWPHQPISRVTDLERAIARTTAMRRFTMLLMSLFGALALVIAMTGIHGVMACTVEQQRHDVAIRLALGAEPGRLLRGILARSSLIAVAGVVVGGAASWGLARFVQSYLFEVRLHDAQLLLMVALALVFVALGASWLPARRAATIDPVVTLKME